MAPSLGFSCSKVPWPGLASVPGAGDLDGEKGRGSLACKLPTVTGGPGAGEPSLHPVTRVPVGSLMVGKSL